MKQTKPRVGIIGGSGLYRMETLEVQEEIDLDTPYGKPSDRLTLGKLDGREVVFLARHGQGHRILPSELNFRANIYAMKVLGVEWLLAVSAVGSLKNHLKPLDVVLVDQYIDRTSKRVSTFFGDGVVAHVGFSEPTCPAMRDVIVQATHGMPMTVHPAGTYVCMEGPQFSTLAESNLYRSWGADLIGMTNLQEAKLAREAEICFATIALVTDYDCWHETEEHVTVDLILENLRKNVDTAHKILQVVVPKLKKPRDCVCANALQNAIVTPSEYIPLERRRVLQPIIGKYIS